MKCHDIQQLLVAYLDGEISPSEKTGIEAHIGICDICRNELNDIAAEQRAFRESLEVVCADLTLSSEARIRIHSRLLSEIQPRAIIFDRWKSKLIGGLKMFKESIFRQPRWRIVTAGIFLIALIVSLSLIIPSFGGDSDIVVAAEEIARNSEAFGFISKGEDLTLVEVVEQDDDQATVTFATQTGKEITFQVDLRAKKIVETDKWVGFPLWGPYEPYEQTGGQLFLKGGPEFEEAIRIALADPEVQKRLPEGLVIESVGLYDDIEENKRVWGREERVADVRFWPANLGEQPVVGGQYIMKGPCARVGLDTKEVIAVNNSEASIPVVQFEYILSEEERQEVIGIISADPKGKQLLAEGFVVERLWALDPSFSVRIADVQLMPPDTLGESVVDGYYVRIDLETNEILGGNDEIMVKVPLIVVQIHE